MEPSILDRIVRDKRQWLEAEERRMPLERFRDGVTQSDRSFYQALSRPRSVFILECKKASPSKGLIRADFDPAAIARVYAPYAAAISVLTDEKYFQGNLRFVEDVRAVVQQPVLCKDFFIDPYQVWRARHHGADAILLMLSVLDDGQYAALAGLAHSLGMGVLTEASTRDEVDRAIALRARVIGINNRNLRDLSVDLDRTRLLAPRVGKSAIVISESGISRHAHVRDLARCADGFLIGSALTGRQDLDGAVRAVILGENKVCGLTRPQDAQAAHAAGAVYGGLIFAPRSPRCVTADLAARTVAAAPLSWVGVFSDQPEEELAARARELHLTAVQLHGSEDAAYVQRLRDLLPDSCAIWKAHRVNGRFPDLSWPTVDRHLLDNGAGGTGRSFDWSLLRNAPLQHTLLAGGLTPENAGQAAGFGCAGLDFNSGLEEAPGKKDPEKIAAAFARLRDY